MLLIIGNKDLRSSGTLKPWGVSISEADSDKIKMAKISALERLEKKIGRIISVYITNLDIFLCGSSVMYAGRFGDKKWWKHWFIVSCEEDANTPRCFRFNAIFSNDDEVEYYPPYRGFIL